MAKAVFIQSRHAEYRDRPGEWYHFPSRNYLRVAAQTVGDWVVFYEGRRGGGRGYYAVQKVLRIEQDPVDEAHHYAILDPTTLLGLEHNVPYKHGDGRPYESRLAGNDGRAAAGGLNTSAMRLLPDADFAAIIDDGLTPLVGPAAMSRNPADSHMQLSGFAESPQATFDTPLLAEREEILTSRKFRDASFARQVKSAYCERCAMSGLELRNGGGRPEVEAAHIRPVTAKGPDTVQNGLALSGTLHWMFDRGLLAVDADHTILTANDSIADDVADRLLTGNRKLILPDDRLYGPHPAYLEWHRREVFKG